MNRRQIGYRKVIVTAEILLSMAFCNMAVAQVQVGGNVYGGGNQADVAVNATVNIGAGQVVGNVYGGGNVGDVGTINKTDVKSYKWTNEANPGETYTYNDTGVCTVSITGGMIGPSGDAVATDVSGNVFGAGKGMAESFWCEKAMVYRTEVSVAKGTVKGNVYGGGEVGRVETNTAVTIGVAPSSDEDKSDPTIVGNVFGAGKGLATHGYSALVRGNTTVLVQQESKVGHTVYGGGEIATVGKYNLVTEENKNEHPGLEVGMPYSIVSDNLGICTVTVKEKADVGHGEQGGDVFGAGKGVEPETYTYADKEHMPKRMMTYDAAEFTEENKGTAWEYYEDYPDDYTGEKYVWEYFKTPAKYMTFVETLALATQTAVCVDGEAKVKGSVYGGSESGFVQHHAQVTIQGNCAIGTSSVEGNIYGGGRGISGNASAGRASGNTTVNILGGTMTGAVYGGGALASSNKGWDNNMYNATVDLKGGDVFGNVYGGGMGDTNTAATVGNVVLNLNKDVENTAKGCIVRGNIFGCNNVNGTPQGAVEVYIYKTQNAAAATIANPVSGEQTAKVRGRYDVKAVYGGGNLAPYEPSDTETSQAKIIIDGCDLTSIQTVYGGGNAASTPATSVTVNGTYEIEELFGGGNGKDDLPNGDPNPGANVGYKDYHLVEDQFTTKESRVNGDGFAPYRYGTGEAKVDIKGGTIHRVFGGSNTKGNVRKTALTLLEELQSGGVPVCPFHVDEAYGGGKSAPMDAEAQLHMACIPGLKEAYGGAEAADIQGDVTLNITNGTFDRVFGGNNISGTIGGAIQVNIEEVGCKPIIIGELYGGGNQAGYSVYGYDGDGKPIESGVTPLFADPVVNVRSFTSIGSVYGGGYGETAVMVGNPTVNINVGMGGQTYHDAAEIAEGTKLSDTYPIPSHIKGKIGAINNVYGGGNAAKVIGGTQVKIGVTAAETLTTVTNDPATTVDESKLTVVGADIRGNVYGGGNNAEVTGDTNVTIGKKNE